MSTSHVIVQTVSLLYLLMHAWFSLECH